MPPLKNRPGSITKPKDNKMTNGERATRVQKSRITVELGAPKKTKAPASGTLARVQERGGELVGRSTNQQPASTSKNGTKADRIVLEIETSSATATAAQSNSIYIASDQDEVSGDSSDLDSLSPGPAPVIESGAHLGPQTILHRLPSELRNIVFDLINPALRKKNKRNYIDLRSTNAKPRLNPEDEINHEHAPVYMAAAFPFLANEINSTFLSKTYIDIQVFSDLLIIPVEPIPAAVACRGGRFGLGNLVLGVDSWIYRADPVVVCIRHIRLSIAEKGGKSICTFTVDVGRSKEGGLMKARAGRQVATKLGRQPDLNAMTKMAHTRVERCTARPDFQGFRLAEVEDIAKSFRSGKLAKDDVKAWKVGPWGGCDIRMFRGGREIVKVKEIEKTG
ncbi:hypothetical protein LTR95_018485 [Oleoguttula sp. CCFEE 5521]